MAKSTTAVPRMAELIAGFDWGSTPLGPIEAWPQSLKTIVDLMLGSDVIMAAPWGPEGILLYNDAYARMIAPRGESALGRPVFEALPELREVLGPHLAEARAGKTLRIDDQLYPFDRGKGTVEDAWYDISFQPVRENGQVIAVLGFIVETTERVLSQRRQEAAEAAQRESEERQAFLLKLSDELRPLSDPRSIVAVATRMLGEFLGVDRIAYGDMLPDDEHIAVEWDWGSEAVPSLVGTYRIAQFGQFIADHFNRGEIAVIDDAASSPDIPREDYEQTWAAIGVRAAIALPVVKAGKFQAAFAVYSAPARKWTATDQFLVEEVGQRIWTAVERARTEAALRDSEERFRQFANASSGALWIRDAGTLKMEYVSPAISSIYGVDRETFLNGVELWASSIVPDDPAVALEHLEQARQGKAVVHEFRIQRADDQSFRWIRNTDFPLYDVQGNIQRIGGIAEDVTESKQAVEHQGVLLAELQHRVRNIMAMIRSVTNRSADGADGVDEYKDLLTGRLLALSRVQVLLTRQANAGGSLHGILESEIGAQAHHQGQYELTGPDIMLSPKAVEVLTLAFHELATNALKYGALSVPGGRLSVNWSIFERKERSWLAVDWAEEGAPPREPSKRRGFGSELIEGKIPYELGGTGKVTIGPGGARCHLELPLTDGESILETDAPMPITIFGGSLDMTGAPDLTGRSILVIEDDYYLATDTAAALRGAGADVLGPCPNEELARHIIETETLGAAVVDLNLGGGGPRFEIARLLQAHGVPFVFLTGYDPDVIPEDFADVARLQKPLPLRDIVEAVSKLGQGTAAED